MDAFYRRRRCLPNLRHSDLQVGHVIVALPFAGKSAKMTVVRKPRLGVSPRLSLAGSSNYQRGRIVNLPAAFSPRGASV